MDPLDGDFLLEGLALTIAKKNAQVVAAIAPSAKEVRTSQSSLCKSLRSLGEYVLVRGGIAWQRCAWLTCLYSLIVGIFEWCVCRSPCLMKARSNFIPLPLFYPLPRNMTPSTYP